MPDTAGDPAPDNDSAYEDIEARSLFDDVEALIDDGKTYLEAEFAFQKTRAAVVADRAKSALIFGAVAMLLGFLALIGLTVGAIIALAPLLTAWGAAALVVGLLMLAAALAARASAKRWVGLLSLIAPERTSGE
ncbi:MAG: hypothetical protein B7Z08_02475 [Sphingomonadales bacterium 32-68-7]|nr:MAG: hypothetical protein B7Z33_02905 [Sphingomonadales bacterium 12-68-11]OYX10105.1 MAG: hypothetical protein B7Z08_02475 [Sphingomonadales bacterium 32-68-7]